MEIISPSLAKGKLFREQENKGIVLLQGKGLGRFANSPLLDRRLLSSDTDSLCTRHPPGLLHITHMGLGARGMEVNKSSSSAVSNIVHYLQ